MALDLGPMETAPEPIIPPLPPPHREVEEVKLTDDRNEETKDVPIVANTAAESVAQAVPEVVTVSKVSRFAGKSKEEIAVIRIQTAFRGYQVHTLEMLFGSFNSIFSPLI